MSFSYQLGANPAIDYPRMLVGDTVEFNGASPPIRVCVFEDEEILSFVAIQSGVLQSSGRYSGISLGAGLPTGAISYLRVAAMMCDALAALKSRMDLTGLQDAKTDFHGSARELRAQAAQWRQIDDESGAFAIIERCYNSFGYRDRWVKEIQRTLPQ